MYLRALVMIFEELLISLLASFKIFLPIFKTLEAGFDDWVGSGTVIYGEWILRSLRDLLA